MYFIKSRDTQQGRNNMYIVLRDWEEIGRSRSIVGAIEIAERSFGCNIADSHKAVRESLKSIQSVVVSACISSEFMCDIKVA